MHFLTNNEVTLKILKVSRDIGSLTDYMYVLKLYFTVINNKMNLFCVSCAKEAKYLAADAERKYEEVARKLNMLETDLLKAMLRSSHKINTE